MVSFARRWLNLKSQSNTPSLSKVERKARESLLELYIEQAWAETV